MADGLRPAGTRAPAAAAWPDGAVTVRVPATSANLGPGFDSFGLALARYDRVEVQVRPAGLAIEIAGFGADLVTAGEDHLVVRSLRAGFAAAGAGQPPGLAIRCQNSIPHGYGLGSSAAAVIAGLLAARALAAEAVLADETVLADGAVLRLATGLEGHADNVAACLSGGLVIAWAGAGGPRWARLQPGAGLAPVICLPAEPMATSAARRVLPAAIGHDAAAANSARAALLIAALTGALGPAGSLPREVWLDATEDFLHQPYRAAAMPASAALITALRSAGVPAVISGAGPAVLALAPAGCPPEQVAAIAAGLPGGWQVQPTGLDLHGATVTAAR